MKNFYLIHLKAGKVVKVSSWSDEEQRDKAFEFYKESQRKEKPWDELQKFEDVLEEFW